MRPQPERPGPGQESVWDYPRPPRLERIAATITVDLGGETIATTDHAWRVLETSHPPPTTCPEAHFRPVFCGTPGNVVVRVEGRARYFDLVTPARVAARAAWSYPAPTAGFEPLADAVAVMAGQVDRCTVDGETVVPQPGGFYGGWITSQVVGPFRAARARGW